MCSGCAADVSRIRAGSRLAVDAVEGGARGADLAQDREAVGPAEAVPILHGWHGGESREGGGEARPADAAGEVCGGAGVVVVSCHWCGLR